MTMPGENKPEEKKDDVKALENKFDSFMDIMSEAVNKPAPQAAAPEVKAEPVFNNQELEEAGFDDKQMTVLEKIVKNAVNSAVGEARKETTALSEQEKYDNMAFKKFPQLRDKNSQMYKAAAQRIAARESYDSKVRQRPDLLWSVGNEIDEIIKGSQDNYSNNNAQRNNSSSASFLEGSRSSSRVENNNKNDEPSDERKWVRQKLGISS